MVKDTSLQLMDDASYKELVECIIGGPLLSSEYYQRDCLIEDGLGISGMEAEEMILRLEKRYGLDLSDFNFASHFCQEPHFFISFGPLPTAPYTIGDVEKGVINKRLV